MSRLKIVLSAVPVVLLGLILFSVVLGNWSSRFVQFYFFFSDGDLNSAEDCLVHFWEVGLNPSNAETWGNFSNGVATLCMSEPDGTEWGWCSFSQGDCAWRIYPDMLYGKTSNESERIPYDCGVEFRRDSPLALDKYFLRVRAVLDNRTFLHEVEGDDTKVNMGVCVYGSYVWDGVELNYWGESDGDNNNYTVIDVYVSSAFWNGSDFEPLIYTHMVDRDNGFTVALTVREWQLEKEGVWRIFEIDFGWVLAEAFELLPEKLESFIVRAVQFYVEGSGVYVEGRFDFVQMVGV